MLVKFTQSVTVDCNDWEALIQHFNENGWTDFFFSLPNKDNYETQNSIEKLARDVGIQTIHTDTSYSTTGGSGKAGEQSKFIEGFGRFHRIDDPWSPDQITTWVWWSENHEHILVIQEEMDEDEVE